MGGRFGKYGDAKRRDRIRKTRLTPPVPIQKKKKEPLKGAGKRQEGRADKPRREP